MNIDELNEYRAQKDSRMGASYGELTAQQRYGKDQFGGPEGIDPNSHGAELQ